MNRYEIDEVYPDHAYDSCNDDDDRCNNSGFNRCARCTELELLKYQTIRHTPHTVFSTSESLP